MKNCSHPFLPMRLFVGEVFRRNIPVRHASDTNRYPAPPQLHKLAYWGCISYVRCRQGAGSSLLSAKSRARSSLCAFGSATGELRLSRRGESSEVTGRASGSLGRMGASVSIHIAFRLKTPVLPRIATWVKVSSRSFWYPAQHSALRGADTAPFRLTVNGSSAISSGVEKSSSGSSVYEQTLNAQPFFVQGEWDRIDGTGDAKDILALVPKGASAEERKQAASIMSLAASARAFYSAMLGPTPGVPIRIVTARRGSGFNEAGTVLLEAGALRRMKIDSGTALLISETVARLWIGGQAAVRGEGGGFS